MGDGLVGDGLAGADAAGALNGAYEPNRTGGHTPPDGPTPPPAPNLPTKPVRVDTWLHAVRLMKTRSVAAQAVRASHVRVNGDTVKPSQQVRPGDRVSVQHPGYRNEYIVVGTLTKRVGAPIARTAYTDVSPPPPALFAAPPRRERGTGRPTKKERRQLDRLRGR